jgi:alkylation response protein AidB-like acyl-CoA dehydrogenase
VHNDIVGHYLGRLGTQVQRERWLPGYCAGELITAIAITEPGAGSDLRGLRTVAALEGDHYVVNGQKTFISNGQLCDLVIVVARTEPGAGYRGLSLLVVERGMPGFTRGRNLDKIGMPAQDTSELFFSDVRVPKTNLLGGRGAGILALMQNLPENGWPSAARPCRGRVRVRASPGVRQGSSGIRSTDRQAAAQPVPADRVGHRARPRPGVHRSRGC